MLIPCLAIVERAFGIHHCAWRAPPLAMDISSSCLHWCLPKRSVPLDDFPFKMPPQSCKWPSWHHRHRCWARISSRQCTFIFVKTKTAVPSAFSSDVSRLEKRLGVDYLPALAPEIPPNYQVIVSHHHRIRLVARAKLAHIVQMAFLTLLASTSSWHIFWTVDVHLHENWDRDSFGVFTRCRCLVWISVLAWLPSDVFPSNSS